MNSLRKINKTDEKLNKFQITTSQGINDLLQYVKSLSPQNIEHYHEIKCLIKKFGLPIMIYLQPFYSQITQQIAKQNKMQLMQIAGLVFQLNSQTDIHQLKFIYNYGKKPTQQKIIKDQITSMFIRFIAELGEINKKIQSRLNENWTLQQYQSYIQENSSNYQFSLLMKTSIQQFKLNKQILSSNLVANYTKQQNKQQWNQDDQEEEEEQQFNFYTGQVKQSSDKSEQQDSTKLSISYSSSQSMSKIDKSFIKSRSQEMNERLCCRTYFIQNQILRYDENSSITFMNARFPFNQFAIQFIKRNMCSMLNCDGGKLFIGINKQKDSGKKIVIGQTYADVVRQQILRFFRKIAGEGIQPQILTNKLYNVDFIPIQDQTGLFIPGACVIRVNANYGIRDQVYSYQKYGCDYFPFRNGVQIIQKHGRQLLKTYRNIVLHPLPIPQPIHPEPCKIPQIGELLNDKYLNQFKKSKNASKIEQNFASKITNDTESVQYKSHLISRPDLSIINPQSQSLTSKNIKHKLVQVKQKENSKTEQQKNGHIPKYCYFIVDGLAENQLSPIFQQRKLKEFVKIESSKQKRLIVKGHGQKQIEKIRKILNKIGEKYASKNVKVFEMTRQMKIDKKFFEIALNKIKTLKINYKVLDENTVKFKLFRDSFSAFIELEKNKIVCQFVQQDTIINKK